MVTDENTPESEGWDRLAGQVRKQAISTKWRNLLSHHWIRGALFGQSEFLLTEKRTAQNVKARNETSRREW